MAAIEHMAQEIDSQPDVWRQAAEVAAAGNVPLPAPGERVAVVGCGTSWFMAQSYAALREHAGHGATDAFAASEAFAAGDAFVERGYDTVLAITRSGTTTELLRLMGRLKGRTRTVAIVGDQRTPIAEACDAVVALPFADEQSVVQTRFATSALLLLRRHLGEDVEGAVRDVAGALRQPVDPAWVRAEQFTFLGHGWTYGLANEAALKMREASQSWTEAYPLLEYRHGPIAIAAPDRVTWVLGPETGELEADVAKTGALFVHHDRDALADLVLVQRIALERARARGLDPDRPRSLTRSVILNA
ncbi:SIS domain-containing protein [Streptomyces sp. NPDC054933]